MNILKKLRQQGWIIKSFIRLKARVKRSLLKNYKKRKQYYPDKEIHANLKDLMYCMLCPNMCRFECPVVLASKKETHSPAIKAQIAYYLEMDRLEKNSENILPLFEGCVHCSACQVWCPFDFAVGDLLEGVAADFFEKKKLPKEVISFSDRIRTNDGLYEQEKYQESLKILKDHTEGQYYYFPGCVSMGNNPNAIRSIISIAEEANVSIVSKPEQRNCCGAPSMYAGDLEECKKFAEYNLRLFKEQKIDAILCECPECAHMLKTGYEKLGYKHEIPVLHISEWIWSLYEQEKISFKNGDKSKKYQGYFPISYHDPCVLARKIGKPEYSYKILKKVFPKNFKETPYSRELTHCCGYGGLVNIANSKLSEEMAKRRLAEFSKEKIKTIITACPTCWYSFMKNNEELEFEILDLVEIISEFLVAVK